MKVWIILVILMMSISTASFAQTAPIAPISKETASAAKPPMKTIFDFQQEIGLSDRQIEDIKKIIEDLQKSFENKAKDLQEMREALTVMLKEKKDLKVIRKQFEKIAAIQVDSSIKDIDASRKIEAVMSKEQFGIWKDIQVKITQESIERMRAAQEIKPQAQTPQVVTKDTTKK